MKEKNQFFELLVLNDKNKIHEYLLMNGKGKSFCPIRIINKEENTNDSRIVKPGNS